MLLPDFKKKATIVVDEHGNDSGGMLEAIAEGILKALESKSKSDLMNELKAFVYECMNEDQSEE